MCAPGTNSPAGLRGASGLIGLVVALIAVGSPTGGDVLANLDLVAVGTLDIDESILAMGPDLPRRAPLQVLLALGSPPLTAATVLRLWMITVIVVAVAGTSRLLAEHPAAIRLGAGIAFGLSPFLLTRLAVGHLGFATAVALLPWAWPTLAAPLSDRRRTLRFLLTFALCGYFGALVIGPALIAGLASTKRWPSVTDVGWFLASQTPWLAPAVATVGSVGDTSSSEAFPSGVDTMADVARLPYGYGFWRTSEQIGATHPLTVAVVSVLVLMAVAGLVWGRRAGDGALVGLGVAGLVMTGASRLPGVRRVYAELTDISVFGPFREGQRFVAFTVFALVVLAARGASILAAGDRRRDRGFGAALAAAALVSWPAFGGLGGVARGHELPAAWRDAARVVHADPGPTLALPYERYLDLDVADGERAHHPVPFLVDVDVIYSHDLVLGVSSGGRDQREDTARTLVRSLRFGEPIGPLVEELGLRWVVALPDLDDGADIERLRGAGYPEVVADASISVFAMPSGLVDTTPDPGLVPWVVLVLDAGWVVLAAGAARALWPGDHTAREDLAGRSGVG